MNQVLIRDLARLVERACRAKDNAFGYGIWSHHISPMVGIAERLAAKNHADREIVVIATLLHDLAGIQDWSKWKMHHVHGARVAEGLLSERDYPKERIDLIKKCILNHRGSVKGRKETAEEICVADADAMSHIDQIGSLFYVAYSRLGLGIDAGVHWIREKLDRDWAKMSSKSKAYYRQKYKHALSVLG